MSRPRRAAKEQRKQQFWADKLAQAATEADRTRVRYDRLHAALRAKDPDRANRVWRDLGDHLDGLLRAHGG